MTGMCYVMWVVVVCALLFGYILLYVHKYSVSTYHGNIRTLSRFIPLLLILLQGILLMCLLFICGAVVHHHHPRKLLLRLSI